MSLATLGVWWILSLRYVPAHIFAPAAIVGSDVIEAVGEEPAALAWVAELAFFGVPIDLGMEESIVFALMSHNGIETLFNAGEDVLTVADEAEKRQAGGAAKKGHFGRNLYARVVDGEGKAGADGIDADVLFGHLPCGRVGDIAGHGAFGRKVEGDFARTGEGQSRADRQAAGVDGVADGLSVRSDIVNCVGAGHLRKGGAAGLVANTNAGFRAEAEP